MQTATDIYGLLDSGTWMVLDESEIKPGRCRRGLAPARGGVLDARVRFGLSWLLIVTNHPEALMKVPHGKLTAGFRKGMPKPEC